MQALIGSWMQDNIRDTLYYLKLIRVYISVFFFSSNFQFLFFVSNIIKKNTIFLHLI
jgi:hypothetical protein